MTSATPSRPSPSLSLDELMLVADLLSDSEPALKAASRVSSAWRAIFQPPIFREITLKSSRQAQRFQDVVIGKPELGQFVRELGIHKFDQMCHIAGIDGLDPPNNRFAWFRGRIHELGQDEIERFYAPVDLERRWLDYEQRLREAGLDVPTEAKFCIERSRGVTAYQRFARARRIVDVSTTLIPLLPNLTALRIEFAALSTYLQYLLLQQSFTNFTQSLSTIETLTLVECSIPLCQLQQLLCSLPRLKHLSASLYNTPSPSAPTFSSDSDLPAAGPSPHLHTLIFEQYMPHEDWENMSAIRDALEQYELPFLRWVSSTPSKDSLVYMELMPHMSCLRELGEFTDLVRGELVDGVHVLGQASGPRGLNLGRDNELQIEEDWMKFIVEQQPRPQPETQSQGTKRCKYILPHITEEYAQALNELARPDLLTSVSFEISVPPTSKDSLTCTLYDTVDTVLAGNVVSGRFPNLEEVRVTYYCPGGTRADKVMADEHDIRVSLPKLSSLGRLKVTMDAVDRFRHITEEDMNYIDQLLTGTLSLPDDELVELLKSWNGATD